MYSVHFIWTKGIALDRALDGPDQRRDLLDEAAQLPELVERGEPDGKQIHTCRLELEDLLGTRLGRAVRRPHLDEIASEVGVVVGVEEALAFQVCGLALTNVNTPAELEAAARPR